MIRRMAARDEPMAKTARAVQWPADNFTEIPVLVEACRRLGVLEGRVPFVRMPHAIESAHPMARKQRALARRRWPGMHWPGLTQRRAGPSLS
jgi:hypothetical protein